MVTINLYQGKGIDLEISFPTSWDELDHEEVVEICKLQLLLADSQAESRATFFFFILQNRSLKQGKPLPEKWRTSLNLEHVAECLYLINFLYEENNLTKQPFTTLQVNNKVLVGLENDFENITCGEFESLEILFHEFIASPSADLLAKMCAIIFREKNVPFQEIINDKLITYDFIAASSHFLPLKAWILYSVYTWYCGCRLNLPAKFPTVYEGDGKQVEPDALAFTKCIHAGAGAVNGTRNQIRVTLLLEYMFEMEQQAIKTKELNNMSHER